MQKLWVCQYVGQNQGVGVGGKGGIWNSSQVTAAHILLWVRMWGCGGGAMMGWGGWWGRGWGEALIEILNKTGIVTFSLVIVMHITRRNRLKSRGIPDFGGIPIVMTSRSRKHVIISFGNEIARDFTCDLIVQYQQEGAAILKIWICGLTSNFWTQIFQ